MFKLRLIWYNYYISLNRIKEKRDLMKYRKFKGSGTTASVLGFGTMRLPIMGDDYGKINEKEAIKMIRHAIDKGVTYIDTAYPYHSGNSEILTGKALKNGYREKVSVATKLPVGHLKEKEDMEKIFNEQLEKLDMDYVDFYLLHAVNRNNWEICKKLNVLDFMQKLKDEGRIKNIGFSFHDSPEIFKEVADAFDWDMCQLQFNYIDTDYQAGMESFRYAADKNINIVIMEPLRGGSLANDLPKQLEEHFNNVKIKKSPVEWAFRWLYNFPEINVILSGMSTMEHVEDNLKIFESAEPNSMSEEENKIMDGAMEIMKNMIAVPCTDCKYCMPCPHGVNIPMMFGEYNKFARFTNKDKIKEQYMKWRNREESRFTADLCIKCGVCLEKCPQRIDIPERLEELDNLMTE